MEWIGNQWLKQVLLLWEQLELVFGMEQLLIKLILLDKVELILGIKQLVMLQLLPQILQLIMPQHLNMVFFQN